MKAWVNMMRSMPKKTSSGEGRGEASNNTGSLQEIARRRGEEENHGAAAAAAGNGAVTTQAAAGGEGGEAGEEGGTGVGGEANSPAAVVGATADTAAK